MIVTVFHGTEGQRAHIGVLTMRHDEWKTFPMRGCTNVKEQEERGHVRRDAMRAFPTLEERNEWRSIEEAEGADCDEGVLALLDAIDALEKERDNLLIENGRLRAECVRDAKLLEGYFKNEPAVVSGALDAQADAEKRAFQARTRAEKIEAQFAEMAALAKTTAELAEASLNERNEAYRLLREVPDVHWPGCGCEGLCDCGKDAWDEAVRKCLGGGT
ncbi:MAG: hypothetical protein A2Z21_10565 [Candidatus Fraserbacteria bacterium RBG_16_55_9]|uniref:Ead/Ea22-like family protein n=1 Tax=Fraserbacteria sp. (strain RBG_16_55_9) TaxID=1817864 RepID=A0A1F5UPT5_FRAXR|nr:MAG: hypothetical protein A2Z21_10565 [Candidatus Fraserbacteria bacterium RBG_16_55_9]